MGRGDHVDALWIAVTSIRHDTFIYHVTRAGAEAAGVLDRVRRRDLER